MAETSTPTAPASTGSSAPSSTPSSAPSTSSSPASTSTATPVKAPSAYGSIPRDKASKIFADLDAKASGTTAPDDASAFSAADESPEPEQSAKEVVPKAKVPGTEEPAQAATAQATADELPQSITEALKSIADPRLRKAFKDGQYIMRDLSRAGVPYQTIRQFIQDAPSYLSLAPTKEVLESISQTAQLAQSLGNDFIGATPEGLTRFAGQLVDSNPVSFVAFTNHLLSNAPDVARYLNDRFGAQTGQAFRKGLDQFFDRGVLNVAQAMKRDSQAEGKEVLGEVADEMLKYLGLDPNAQPQQQRQPDERDLENIRLREEVNRARAERFEQFQSSVVNTAGNTLDSQIGSVIDRTAFNPAAKAALKERIGKALYEQLLTNKHVQSLVANINRTGRGDQNHATALVNLYVNAGQRLLPQIAQGEIRALAELVRPTITQREARVNQQVSNRDVTASGPPAAQRATGPVKRTLPPGRDAMKEILSLVDQRAEQGS